MQNFFQYPIILEIVIFSYILQGIKVYSSIVIWENVIEIFLNNIVKDMRTGNYKGSAHAAAAAE